MSRSYYNEGKVFQVSVQEIVRGPRAFQRLLSVNLFNDPPEDRHEWILFKVRVHYAANQDGVANDLDEEIVIVSSNGSLYDEEFAIEPEPDLEDVALWPDAMQEGWVAWQVAVDDERPLMLFGSRNYEGGQWFSLESAAEPTQTPTAWPQPTATPTPAGLSPQEVIYLVTVATLIVGIEENLDDLIDVLGRLDGSVSFTDEEWRVSLILELVELALNADEIRSISSVPFCAQSVHPDLVAAADSIDQMISQLASGIDNLDIESLDASEVSLARVLAIFVAFPSRFDSACQ